MEIGAKTRSARVGTVTGRATLQIDAAPSRSVAMQHRGPAVTNVAGTCRQEEGEARNTGSVLHARRVRPMQALLPTIGKRAAVAGRKIFLRFAQSSDVERLTREGVITAPPPAKETWNQRIVRWLSEQRAGRRAVLIAEDSTGLLGILHLVFELPIGFKDPEAANGFDIAMIEGLHLRAGVPPEVGNEMIEEIQRIATKRKVTTLTFCIPMNQPRAIRQVKDWGFEEFRIMAEPSKMLAFFRKTV